MAKGYRGGSFGGGMSMGGGMRQSDLMKQAQKMQQDMLKMQEELDARTYSASAGGIHEPRGFSQNGLLQTLVLFQHACERLIGELLP